MVRVREARDTDEPRMLDIDNAFYPEYKVDVHA